VIQAEKRSKAIQTWLTKRPGNEFRKFIVTHGKTIGGVIYAAVRLFVLTCTERTVPGFKLVFN